MYSPTTRLLTILELLQSHRQMSGTELARRLEVDKRTIRRYMVMLQDMGIPIEAERGPDGAYHLQRGYKLPPLMFTDSEAVALSLSLLLMRAFQLPVDTTAMEGALAKTERVLPETLLQQVSALQDAITFSVSPPPVRLPSAFVSSLSLAVQQGRRVHLRYRAFSGEESERDFDPYGVVFHEGYWYASGYCHLRGDLRTFRMDRIVTLDVREDRFERPAAFDALEHVLGSIATMPGTHRIVVLLQTTMEQVCQTLTPDAGILEETNEGVLWRRETHDLRWVASLLLCFDFPVVIREPAELRDLMREVAAKALRMAENPWTE